MLQKIALAILLFTSSLSFAESVASTSIYPCANGSILTYFKRPTIITSACPVPYGQFTLDGGIQYNEFINRDEKWTLPQSKTRIGLPWLSELSILFPSERINSHANILGLFATQLALKHDIAYTQYWNVATRVVYIPASGSKDYGTAHDGYSLNGILAYKTPIFNFTAMASISSWSTSSAAGGVRYNSFSPDVCFGWYARNWLQFYLEVFGQTRTAPNQGAGYNLDTGLIFLITKDFAIDMEIGKSLSGELGNFNTYYGGGVSFMF
ncbi:transporter [Legionella sp. PATHC038]|uniref:transporter n=1 Tax=Legionella sheltonii TaxID=2992041 RepID=UPI0022442071|nr:transporter [Legionella sp. PATHC038]MCW8397306.1 transporter [Legionella sp. PATHC038]